MEKVDENLARQIINCISHTPNDPIKVGNILSPMTVNAQMKFQDVQYTKSLLNQMVEDGYLEYKEGITYQRKISFTTILCINNKRL